MSAFLAIGSNGAPALAVLILHRWVLRRPRRTQILRSLRGRCIGIGYVRLTRQAIIPAIQVSRARLLQRALRRRAARQGFRRRHRLVRLQSYFPHHPQTAGHPLRAIQRHPRRVALPRAAHHRRLLLPVFPMERVIRLRSPQPMRLGQARHRRHRILSRRQRVLPQRHSRVRPRACF